MMTPKLRSSFCCFLAAGIALAGTAHAADCTPMYRDAYRVLKAGGDRASNMSLLSTTVGFFVPVFFFPASTSSTTAGAAEEALANTEKVLRVLNEATMGEGLALNQFVVDVARQSMGRSVPVEKIRDSLLLANSKGIFCAQLMPDGQHRLYSYEEIVSFVALDVRKP